MAVEDRTDWPTPVRTLVARVSDGKPHHNTLKVGRCFLYVRVMSEEMNVVLANTPFTIQGAQTGYSLSGKTDAEGILRFEKVPDDHYEITCEGATEPIELLYHEYRPYHEELPWALRLRGVRRES
jgi:hypothetical protein